MSFSTALYRIAWRSFGIAVVLLAILFAFVAHIYLQRYSISTIAATGIYLAFVVQLTFALLPGFYRGRGIQPHSEPSSPSVVYLLIWFVPYFLYAGGTGDFRPAALLKLAAIAVPPLVIYRWFPPRKLHAFCWQDACVALVLVSAVLTAQLKAIWNVPTNLDFLSRLFVITVASWCWTFLRVVPGLGYSFSFSRKVLEQAMINFAGFAAIAIPLSLAMNFTRWNPQWPGIAPFLLNYLEIFLFIALLEELFFRGFLQSLLSKTLGSPGVSQLVISALFGLFHILHAPFPNWRYVLLASIAGWFYGSAFRNSGSIMASSLVHAAVDTCWRTWFSMY